MRMVNATPWMRSLLTDDVKDEMVGIIRKHHMKPHGSCSRHPVVFCDSLIVPAAAISSCSSVIEIIKRLFDQQVAPGAATQQPASMRCCDCRRSNWAYCTGCSVEEAS